MKQLRKQKCYITIGSNTHASQSSCLCYKMGEQPGTLGELVTTGRILPRTHLAVDPGQEHEGLRGGTASKLLGLCYTSQVHC
jgi:hypothetical protein